MGGGCVGVGVLGIDRCRQGEALGAYEGRQIQTERKRQKVKERGKEHSGS